MPSVALSRTALYVLMILGCLQLAAQSSRYHTETQSDGRSVGFLFLVLVNDSNQPIEAYAGSRRCENPGGKPSVSQSSAMEDVLDSPRGVSDRRMASGEGGPLRSGVLDPGARWRTQISMPQGKGDCQGRIDACFSPMAVLKARLKW
jgi:hypothetical protein